MVTVPVASLVLDYTVYPRQHVDDQNLKVLREAYHVGEVLPPVDIDRASRRVVDGFHRVIMRQREDPAALIEIIEHDYASEAELFLDAVRRNARHGNRLTPYDRSRCLQLAADLSIDPHAIAGALAISVDLTAEIRATRTAYDPEGKPTQIKRSLRHLAGSTLSPRQVHANEKSSGWPARFHAQQLVLLIEGDAVDWSNVDTVNALRHALDVLTTALATH